MANELSIFSNDEFGSVRAFTKEGAPWFVANDVATALGYADAKQAVRDHCNYAELLKGVESTPFTSSPRGIMVIPESDVYALIFGSKLPSADKFRRWVCEEVLPSFRKTGSYSMPQITPGPLADKVIAAQVIFRAANLKDNQLTLALDKVYRADTGKSALETAGIQLKAPVQTNMLTPTEIGAVLAPHMSAKAVNRVLEAQGLQYRLPNGKWEPTELADEYGYVLLDTNKRHSDGTPVTQLKWSTKVLDILRR